MRIGAWVWPSFAIVDAYMCFVAFPSAPFGRFMLYRAVVWVAMVAAYRATFRVGVRARILALSQNANFVLAALVVALMATSLGGVRSPYMHGISIVALVRASIIPQRWRQAWPTFALIGLAFPLVMGVGAAISPAARADWLARDSLVVFAANFIFVVASAFLGLVSSNIVWQAQQRLYRARRIGRYRLQAPIGKGGMGEVWLAWDTALQRNVALKLLRVDEGGVEALERFEREALAASRLQSPHVVQVFDYGASEDGLYYIAMEYLSGIDLQKLVEKEGRLGEERAVHILNQACLALMEAHAAGLIHRDIKPHNLFVTHADGDDDFVKLLDFGVVRMRGVEANRRQLTWTGAVVGTPAYLAPEVWAGAAADERSDIYALGMTLHFLLTGKLPQRPEPSAQTLAEGEWSTESPQTSTAALRRELALIVERCLAGDPSRRLQSAQELHAALTAARHAASHSVVSASEVS